MKRGIAFYLALLLTVFGILSSSLAGVASYLKSRDLLVKAAEDEMTASTRVFGRRLSEALGEIARDARVLARHPLAAELLANNRGAGGAEDRMAELLIAVLGVHQEYFQIRLIDADQYGIERVRVDRVRTGENPLQRVRGEDLQEKGFQPYVFRALKLARDGVHLSRIAINHELGSRAGENQPSIQVSVPVLGDGPEALGVVVINVDLNSLFKLLKTDLGADTSLYLANKWGDFLIHPDPAKTFAFDEGRRELVQETFPSTAPLVAGSTDKVVVTGEFSGSTALVASFLRIDLKQNDGDLFLLLGQSKPLAAITAKADALGAITLYIVIGASVLALLTAVVVARTMTGPLSQMVDAIGHFSQTQKMAPLPVGRHDEIGLLARSFNDMQRQISQQMKALHDHKLGLEHLIRHDTLTELPNRKLFFDRLEQALARSRRSGHPFALFYLDLDRFKQINDSLGHAAGDVVLKIASQRMLDSVREIDTVARLGGDEFIVLIDGVSERSHLQGIAEKILSALARPIEYQEHRLSVEASIGISIFPLHGHSATDLITRADDAMYAAKKGGRNNFRFADAAAATICDSEAGTG